MKKLVTLMLALAMIISAVGVLAEADGKITICEEQRKLWNRYLQTMTAGWRQAGSPRT